MKALPVRAEIGYSPGVKCNANIPGQIQFYQLYLYVSILQQFQHQVFIGSSTNLPDAQMCNLFPQLKIDCHLYGKTRSHLRLVQSCTY